MGVATGRLGIGPDGLGLREPLVLGMGLAEPLVPGLGPGPGRPPGVGDASRSRLASLITSGDSGANFRGLSAW